MGTWWTVMAGEGRVRIGRLVLLLVGAVHACSAAALAQQEDPPAWLEKSQTGEEFDLPISDRLSAETDAALAGLHSPVYEDRHHATERLIDLGACIFPQLRDNFHLADDLEVRLLIERIARRVYLSFHVFDRNGFLGISQRRRPLNHDDDPRINEGHFGVEIGRVIRDTAAEEAGLAKGDVIVSFDGSLLAAPDPTEPFLFGELIRRLAPGVTVEIIVLRADRSHRVEAVLRPRPPQYYGRNQGTAGLMLAHFRDEFPRWWQTHFIDSTHRPSPPASDP